MKYSEARKAYHKAGAAHATGDAYRAMCADTIAFSHGGKPARYYAWLQTNTKTDANDEEIRQAYLPLMRDRAKAWAALMDAPA